MKKIIFGIFAHPDDEAFGPAGTLLMETDAGSDVHLITLTNGDAGTNIDNHTDLGAVRLKEWREAGKLIGATTMTCLNYQDGKLCNQDMVEIGDRLISHIQSALSEAPADCQIELMSIDLNGISGHIDHIVAGRASCFAFYRLKKHDDRFTRLRLACISDERLPEANTNWLYMEKGRSITEIDETIDARRYKDRLVEIIKVHHSQRSDGDAHIRYGESSLGLNHFKIFT